MRCGVVGPAVNTEIVDPEIIRKDQDNVRTVLCRLGIESNAERNQKEEWRSFHAGHRLGGRVCVRERYCQFAVSFSRLACQIKR